MNIYFSLYKLTEKREKELWENSVIVFDSSALLDIYFLPKQTREKIFENLFSKKLKERLWIPSHVSFEYNKNRDSVIRKPIIENCKPLKDITLKSIRKSIKSIEDSISELKNKTKKEDKYPHLPQEEIDKYAIRIESLKKDSETFEKIIIDQINKAENEISDLANNDDVYIAIEKHFQVGRDYSFNEIIEITKEGKHRYEFSIPPGYKDLKEKVGTQIFGDLIIWKQIIEYASEIKKPILFICNDIKEDWCYKEDGTEKRIKSPREELIKEIYDLAKVEFWMYNLPQFLYKSNEYVAESPEDKIDSNKIQKFSHFLTERSLKKLKNRNRVIYDELTKCYICDGKDGYGNYITSWSETDIINEYLDSHPNSEYYSAYIGSCNYCNTLHIECPKCHSVSAIMDVHYNQEFECEGGCGIIFYIDQNYSPDGFGEFDIKILDHRMEQCENCGKDFIDNNLIGLCEECENKYINE